MSYGKNLQKTARFLKILHSGDHAKVPYNQPICNDVPDRPPLRQCAGRSRARNTTYL